MYIQASKERQVANDAVTDAWVQLQRAVANLQGAQSQLTKVELQTGKVLNLLRQSGFSNIFMCCTRPTPEVVSWNREHPIIELEYCLANFVLDDHFVTLPDGGCFSVKLD
jgi:hypothetical protein